MKKTLIVSYTPRIDSNTKKLLDHFVEKIHDKTEITSIDLAKTTPDLLLADNLNLMVKRNFAGIPLSEEESKLLATNDQMTQQVLDTDFIFLAYPMFNFSLPATVKAWIDGVIQAGKTFARTETGFRGLCEGKQALVVMTTGSDFRTDPLKNMNFATPLIESCLGFIGIQSEHISAFGMQQYADKVGSILDDAKQEISAFCKKWY